MVDIGIVFIISDIFEGYSVPNSLLKLSYSFHCQTNHSKTERLKLFMTRESSDPPVPVLFLWCPNCHGVLSRKSSPPVSWELPQSPAVGGVGGAMPPLNAGLDPEARQPPVPSQGAWEQTGSKSGNKISNTIL